MLVIMMLMVMATTEASCMLGQEGAVRVFDIDVMDPAVDFSTCVAVIHANDVKELETRHLHVGANTLSGLTCNTRYRLALECKAEVMPSAGFSFTTMSDVQESSFVGTFVIVARSRRKWYARYAAGWFSSVMLVLLAVLWRLRSQREAWETWLAAPEM